MSLWGYGCHCVFLGDRPMSEMGHGHPVDELDRSCRSYKECQKCVREKQGETCIAELRKYKWNPVGTDAFSTENAGTCERSGFSSIPL